MITELRQQNVYVMRIIPNLFFDINLERNGPLCRKNFPELLTKYDNVSVLQRAAYFIELMEYPTLSHELTSETEVTKNHQHILLF